MPSSTLFFASLVGFGCLLGLISGSVLHILHTAL
jgi:hypothetical protein